MPPTVQAVLGVIPPVLLRLTFVNVGLVASLNVGATVPLKFTVPELLKPEFIAIVCALVPEYVAVPLLVNVPLFEKLPANVVVVPPAAYACEVSLYCFVLFYDMSSLSCALVAVFCFLDCVPSSSNDFVSARFFDVIRRHSISTKASKNLIILIVIMMN